MNKPNVSALISDARKDCAGLDGLVNSDSSVTVLRCPLENGGWESEDVGGSYRLGVSSFGREPRPREPVLEALDKEVRGVSIRWWSGSSSVFLSFKGVRGKPMGCCCDCDCEASLKGVSGVWNAGEELFGEWLRGEWGLVP